MTQHTLRKSGIISQPSSITIYNPGLAEQRYQLEQRPHNNGGKTEHHLSGIRTHVPAAITPQLPSAVRRGNPFSKVASFLKIEFSLYVDSRVFFYLMLFFFSKSSLHYAK